LCASVYRLRTECQDKWDVKKERQVGCGYYNTLGGWEFKPVNWTQERGPL
jgi:hypothetical protein